MRDAAALLQYVDNFLCNKFNLVFQSGWTCLITYIEICTDLE